MLVLSSVFNLRGSGCWEGKMNIFIFLFARNYWKPSAQLLLPVFVYPACFAPQLAKSFILQKYCVQEKEQKKFLPSAKSNLLPLPTWCAQMDGCRARGTSHGPPPGQTRIYNVASVCPFSLSFVGKGRKLNLFVLFPYIPDLCSQQCKNPRPKESAPKLAQEMQKK